MALAAEDEEPGVPDVRRPGAGRAGRAGRAGQGVELLVDVVVRAVLDGRLDPSATRRELRAHLRELGLGCTPAQARDVRQALDVVQGRPGAERVRPPSVGDRLAQARRGRGLTLRELAAAAGCSTSYLSYIEAGERHPRSALLDALAAVVGTDPHWLRTGEPPEARRRITASLQAAEEAAGRQDRMRLRHHLDELESVDGTLQPDEQDRVTFLQVALLVGTGEWVRAHAAALPLMRRAARSTLAVPVLPLGVYFLRAATQQDEWGRSVLAEATQLVLQVLKVSRPAAGEDTTAWGRLAASAMTAMAGAYGVGMARAQATAWLAELDARDPANRPAAARLLWNLAVYDGFAGRAGEALEKLTCVVRWIDPAEHPLDGSRARLLHAQMLTRAHPDRVREAIDELASVRECLERIGYSTDLPWWTLALAEAELARGETGPALARVRALLDGPPIAPLLQLEAMRMLGDLLAARGEPDAAHREYVAAARKLAAWEGGSAYAPERIAALWSSLGEGFERLGESDAVVEACRRALSALGVAQDGGAGAAFAER